MPTTARSQPLASPAATAAASTEPAKGAVQLKAVTAKVRMNVTLE